MAVTFLGLTIGSTFTGFVVPTYAEWREAFGNRVRELKGLANLNTAPGSFYGIILDWIVQGIDLAGQNALEVVTRTIFTAMEDVALDQFLADYMTRVVPTPSTATVFAYGTSGVVVPAATAVRTSAVGVPFAYLGAVAIPAVPAEAYAVEILPFAAGAYAGQLFSVDVDGTTVDYVANGADSGATVRDGLITGINLAALPQTAHFAGARPTTGEPTLIVADLTGGGPWAIVVAGPVGAIAGYPAASGATDTGAVLGPTYAPAGSLRYGASLAGVRGYANIAAAVPGRVRESNSQLRARYQIAQRGRGGGSPDAITAIMLAPVEVGGGGCTFCSVEYNPGDLTDAAGNLPHSVRVVIGVDDDGQAAADALGPYAKAAGDNTNGPETYSVEMATVPPTSRDFQIDRLTELWVAVDVQVSISAQWPVTGNPLTQLRQDIVDYVNALQPSNIGVLVTNLPIANYPNGQPRGVVSYLVRVGSSVTQGGPYAYGPYYPIPEDDAASASLAMTSRQKAMAQVVDVTAIVI